MEVSLLLAPQKIKQTEIKRKEVKIYPRLKLGLKLGNSWPESFLIALEIFFDRGGEILEKLIRLQELLI